MTFSETLETQLITYVLPIILFFVIAYIIHRVSNRLSQVLRPFGNITQRNNLRRFERMRTIQSLVSNAISIGAFVLAILFSLTLFIEAATLLWVVGLFSAAFGLGARPFISDYLTGMSFIFEDIFFVGDKIEIPVFPQRVEGVVEKITLRVTQVRGLDGELFTMPNGDIRLVRNFTRGENSPTSITVKIPAADIGKALQHLEVLGEKAMTLLPNLIEPWLVINKTGELGDEVELTILAKAKFGKGAELRTRMLALIQTELSGLKIVSEAQPEEDKPIDKSSKTDPEDDLL